MIAALTWGVPHPAVPAWVAAQPRADLYTTRINQAEILHDIAGLPEGRRTALAAATNAMLDEDFAARILPFAATAAARYPAIVLRRRQPGQPIGKCDALIAATALAAGASIATRDLGGCRGCGLAVIDPWTASSTGASHIHTPRNAARSGSRLTGIAQRCPRASP